MAIIQQVLAMATAGTSYEAEATALFARFGTDPGTTRKNAINTCIASLKTAGVWSKLDALWVMAAHEQASAILNWKSTSYTLTLNIGTSFTTDLGITNNGASTPGITTGVTENALSVYAQDSAHLSVWARSSNDGDSWWYNSSAGGAGLYPRYPGDTFYGMVNDASGLFGIALSPATAVGFSLANRSGANDRELYKNGTLLASSNSIASRALNAGNLNLFSAGVSAEISAATIGGSLNNTEQLALYNALNTLKTAIGW